MVLKALQADCASLTPQPGQAAAFLSNRRQSRVQNSEFMRPCSFEAPASQLSDPFKSKAKHFNICFVGSAAIRPTPCKTVAKAALYACDVIELCPSIRDGARRRSISNYLMGRESKAAAPRALFQVRAGALAAVSLLCSPLPWPADLPASYLTVRKATQYVTVAV